MKLISDEANSLRVLLRVWVSTHLQDLRDAALPDLPDCLSDRQQEGAEPVLAIADAAGGDWPSLSRTALKELYSTNNAADESLGVSLLSDLRDIFCKKDAEELSSKELVSALLTLDGRPWPASDHSGPITQNGLARLLAPFDIFPRNLRAGRSVLRGYKRECFSDAWSRYLTPLAPPVPGLTNATPLQPAKELIQVPLGKKPPEPDVAAAETPLRPNVEGVVAP
jgi:hypothetical protein